MSTQIQKPTTVAEDFVTITLELAAAACRMPVAAMILEDDVLIYNNTDSMPCCEVKKWLTDFYKSGCAEMETEIHDVRKVNLVSAAVTIKNASFGYYAGKPLINCEGQCVGYLCVLDIRPNCLTPHQQQMLTAACKQLSILYRNELVLPVLTRRLQQNKQTETKLRSFTESDHAFQMLIDKNFRVLTYNKGMADFVCCRHGIALYEGIPVSAILSGGLLEKCTSEFEEVFAGKTITTERRLNYSGQLIWWHIKLEPFYSEEGDIIAISYSAKDITNQKCQEQTVMKQKKNLRKIAFDLSHDLRQQVAVILGLLEIFRLNDYRTDIADIILLEDCAHKLDDKIRNIVEVAR